MNLLVLSLSTWIILVKGLSLDFNIEKADLLKNPIIDWGTVKLTKINRTTYIAKGKLKFLREFNNDLKFGGDLFQMQGGEYRKMPYKLAPKGWCDFVQNDVLIIPEVLATTNLPKKETCPFPPGDYIAYGYYPDISKAPSFLNGRFKVIAYFILDDKRNDLLEGFVTLQHYM